MEKTPQEAEGVARLKAWAIGPEGMRVFKWGVPGDFSRCQKFYAGKIPARMIDGWCAELHRLATGKSPGHAVGAEQAMADAKHTATVAKNKAKS